MCLAVPGKIISIDRSDASMLMAEVSFGGIIKKVCLDFLPESKPGEYVMVHVGFAISRVDEKEARESLKMISEVEKRIIKGSGM
ncbi:MAG: HypC/HybG/HupF family hydrogenase formation chaperone [Acidobacteriota bacterium]